MFIQSRGLLRICLIPVLAAGLPASSIGQRKVLVNPTRCVRPSEAQKNWLTPEWQNYLDYTRICTVRNSKGQTVLFLASVRADLYYKAQSGPSVTMVKLPSPLLFLPSGEQSGSLPYNFPDDPPSELRVTFLQWKHDFPQKIELFLTDPRASGNRFLPALMWDESKKKFVSGEEASHD